MYFFRVELGCFGDEKKVFFLIPDQTATDEKGVPFSETQLINSPEFKGFVKDTQTDVVDVSYTTFKCSENISEQLTAEKFAELDANELLETVESNDFPISTGKKQKRFDLKTLTSNKMYLAIAGGAVVLLIIVIIAIASSAGKSPDKELPESSEITESTDSGESSENSESTSSSSNSESAENSSSSSSSESSSTTSSEYTDVPPESTETGTADTNENGYTDSGYKGGGSSGGASGTYKISFNANGGEGTLESISSAAGQYVTLPKAEDAAKYISKKGYKLIGFSDNTEILYPLYDYKMPYNNVTLFAVWEPATYVVSYNSNGGTGSLSRAEVKYGAEIPLPVDAAIYKDGLHLAGWARSESAKTALKSLKMPAENITLYAVWNEKAPTAKLTLHYDDKVQVLEKEVGSTVNMLDDFGVSKEGQIVSGWYLENSPVRLETLLITENCDVYAQWQTAEYVTVTIDQSYLNKAALTYKIPLDMTGAAKLKLPVVDDKNDIYNHVFGCTYGFSTKKQSGEFGTIEYFGGEEYKFRKDTTLYRVLNEYGGGEGTKSNPYIISYYDQLIRLSENKASGHFKQTADITFPANTERKPIDTKTISRGYADKNYDFFVYDGQGYSVKNLSGAGGLFGKVAGATIKNVVIKGANIRTDGFKNVGILCNEVISYSFPSTSGSETFSTGNSRIENCEVSGKISAYGAENVGGLIGCGGAVSDCCAHDISVSGETENFGGIVGNACSVTGSLANGITTNGFLTSAGGIAGTAYGAEIHNGGKTYNSGGNIIGCGVRFFTSTATNSGGIVGTSTAMTSSAYIKSCYVANVYLNGANNGGISGSDGAKNPHRIAYCLVDNSNGYPVIGGADVRSISKTMVLSVPADSGLTVDGVLSVLNAESSGYSEWKRENGTNNGYPFPNRIFD